MIKGFFNLLKGRVNASLQVKTWEYYPILLLLYPDFITMSIQIYDFSLELPPLERNCSTTFEVVYIGQRWHFSGERCGICASKWYFVQLEILGYISAQQFIEQDIHEQEFLWNICFSAVMRCFSSPSSSMTNPSKVFVCKISNI